MASNRLYSGKFGHHLLACLQIAISTDWSNLEGKANQLFLTRRHEHANSKCHTVFMCMQTASRRLYWEHDLMLF